MVLYNQEVSLYCVWQHTGIVRHIKGQPLGGSLSESLGYCHMPGFPCLEALYKLVCHLGIAVITLDNWNYCASLSLYVMYCKQYAEIHSSIFPS